MPAKRDRSASQSVEGTSGEGSKGGDSNALSWKGLTAEKLLQIEVEFLAPLHRPLWAEHPNPIGTCGGMIGEIFDRTAKWAKSMTRRLLREFAVRQEHEGKSTGYFAELLNGDTCTDPEDADKWRELQEILRFILLGTSVDERCQGIVDRICRYLFTSGQKTNIPAFFASDVCGSTASNGTLEGKYQVLAFANKTLRKKEPCHVCIVSGGTAFGHSDGTEINALGQGIVAGAAAGVEVTYIFPDAKQFGNTEAAETAYATKCAAVEWGRTRCLPEDVECLFYDKTRDARDIMLKQAVYNIHVKAVDLTKKVPLDDQVLYIASYLTPTLRYAWYSQAGASRLFIIHEIDDRGDGKEPRRSFQAASHDCTLFGRWLRKVLALYPNAETDQLGDVD